jgi:gamma-glutamyltranspeptidase/glutathione hydrolase
MFTTRPEILGTFGVVTSTHWLASQSGMKMLEEGGNAFDACAAAAFVLQVVEPHLVGPGGEVPAVFYSAATGKIEVLCGQGVAPKGATIAEYTRRGLTLIPGSGMLATVNPGAFDAWMILLRDHGRLKLRDILKPAIHYARHGHPMLPRVADTIRGVAEMFRKEWPTSAATFLPGDRVPEGNALFRNEQLGRTYKRIVKEAEASGGNRERQIEAARKAWSRGFVAEAIHEFVAKTEAMDSSGQRNRGVLTGDDMTAWEASYERPASYDYLGWTVHKTGPWGQGPAFLQTLALLKSADLGKMDPAGAEFMHTVAEAMKLAFADREAYYGDPEFIRVPLKKLLSDSYNAERRKLMTGKASHTLTPGVLPKFEAQVKRALAMLDSARGATLGSGDGEPTMQHMKAASRRGDTVHIDVIDKWGNMISATPSGGWLQSSPVIPDLGFPLNSRAQMFWLEEGLPASLAPGKRPRTTLTPTLAAFEGKPTLVIGTPGGDQQDQWQLTMFLRHVHHGLNLQEAIDLPLFHTQHFPSSFYPRDSKPGNLTVEENAGPKVIEALKKKGHEVEVAAPWSVGRLTGARLRPDGVMAAAATPRLMQAYAVGR